MPQQGLDKEKDIFLEKGGRDGIFGGRKQYTGKHVLMSMSFQLLLNNISSLKKSFNYYLIAMIGLERVRIPI